MGALFSDGSVMHSSCGAAPPQIFLGFVTELAKTTKPLVILIDPRRSTVRNPTRA
jgi:hypothetical protein